MRAPSTLWLGLTLLSATAFAQSRGGSHGGGGGGGVTVHGNAGASNSGPVVFNLERSHTVFGDTARAKASQGDCKGALDLFDEALRHSEDPTLYRDRGECHDKLGNVYPAIDDFRIYLARMPDAKDADKYRARLGVLVKGASEDIATTHVGGGGNYESEMRGGVGLAPNAQVKTHEDPVESKSEVPPPNDARPLSTVEYEQKRDKESRSSPLRDGKGFILGAVLFPRYVFNPWAFRFGQGVDLALRYSFSANSTVFAELGYMSQLGRDDLSKADGFSSCIGYELRVPLDHWASDQLFFGGCAGYERMNNALLGQVYDSFVARGRAGYRHVFGPSLALEGAADGGLMFTVDENAPTGARTSGVGALIGGQVSLVVGF